MKSRTFTINGNPLSVSFDCVDTRSGARIYNVAGGPEPIPEVQVVAKVLVHEDGKVVLPSHNAILRVKGEEIWEAVKSFLIQEHGEGVAATGIQLHPHPAIAHAIEVSRPVDAGELEKLQPGEFDHDDIDGDAYNKFLLPWFQSQEEPDEWAVGDGYVFTKGEGNTVHIKSSHYFNPETGELCLGHEFYEPGIAPHPVRGVNTKVDISPENIIGGRFFEYRIDLDERGSFRAHVEDSETGFAIFQILDGNELGEGETSVFEDGFMADKHDVAGLTEWLRSLGIIPPNAEITNAETPRRSMRI